MCNFDSKFVQVSALPIKKLDASGIPVSRIDSVKSTEVTYEAIQISKPRKGVGIGTVGVNVIQNHIAYEGHFRASTFHHPVRIAVGFSYPEVMDGKSQTIDRNGLPVGEGSIGKCSRPGPFITENSAPLLFFEHVRFTNNSIRSWCRNDVYLHSRSQLSQSVVVVGMPMRD